MATIVKHLSSITTINKINCYEIKYKDGEAAQLTILNHHVIRFYMSPTGKFKEYPTPNNPNDHAKMNSKSLKSYGSKAFEDSLLESNDTTHIVKTDEIQIAFDVKKGTMAITDLRNNKEVMKETNTLSYNDIQSTQELCQHKDEYFFGGGMLPGKYTHKGEIIKIVCTENACPCPFYWSNYGYGVVRNTWHPGKYDFSHPTTVITSHESVEFDAFYFINDTAQGILGDYFELIGPPLLMPEYALYEAHFGTFNEDHWVPVNADEPGAILFEDNLYYKRYTPHDQEHMGILESLNGYHQDHYQFSARAMVDRYQRHEMPLGWFIPNNEGGYGQTDSLRDDINNLKEFALYARANGVNVGLRVKTDLVPHDSHHPKKNDRYLKKEIKEAGIVAFKTGASGYSAGLSKLEVIAKIFTDVHNVRFMATTVRGWAGTQRYSGINTEYKHSGHWENIRFHIPTFIGSGLSGQPIVGSEIDGALDGEENKKVNIREFQWTTFTPLQLNVDGYALVRKAPFAFDEEAKSINRAYLKLKSKLMPYNYTIAYQSTSGLPMMRAMCLEYPQDLYAHSVNCQYQFMWGPSLLIAPIYSGDEISGDSVRNCIYLPDPKQVWIDFFTGTKYLGGRVINELRYPLWKLPVFVKDGAIIPCVNLNNNPSEIKRDTRIFLIYPNGKSSFTIYEDDGISRDYKNKLCAETKIEVIGPKSNERGELSITIHPTEGEYKEMVQDRKTIINIMSSKDITSNLKVTLDDTFIQLTKINNISQFYIKEDVYIFNTKFSVNPYLDELAKEEILQSFITIKLKKVNVTESTIQITMKDYQNKGKIFGNHLTEHLNLGTPKRFTADLDKITATSVTLMWEPVEEAEFYDIERDAVLFSRINKECSRYDFDNLSSDNSHKFRIRSMQNIRVSQWSEYIIVKTHKQTT